MFWADARLLVAGKRHGAWRKKADTEHRQAGGAGRQVRQQRRFRLSPRVFAAFSGAVLPWCISWPRPRTYPIPRSPPNAFLVEIGPVLL
jgi:hypothetical protein